MSTQNAKNMNEMMMLAELASNAQSCADRLAVVEFEAEAKKVAESGDTKDLVVLTAAIRHWREFNGGDACQPGTLIASILHITGAAFVTGSTEAA
ncbi:MAG: hypothetical protein JNM66_14450 [Bryobacterales bacterium]|nr:hypothetical protein [Bryobacterales bacterium]